MTASMTVVDFNPLHREGGDGRRRLFHFPDIHFNPLHREGGDGGKGQGSSAAVSISIHSTARVETTCFISSVTFFVISIHSTARVETTNGVEIGAKDIISIHSTARVETFMRSRRPLGTWHFNPLHREGGDKRPLSDAW